MKVFRFVLTFVMITMAACGSDEPIDVSGDYTASVTAAENGCGFEGWTEGSSTTNIPVVITQNDTEVSTTVEGAIGLFLGVLLGSNVFTGTVDGDSIELTLFGSTSATEGNCTYTINSTIRATVDDSRDTISGQIRYEAATNDNPDCITLGVEGCVSIQNMNGTRPPQ